MSEASADLERGQSIAARGEAFVRGEIIPFEKDSRWGSHGPPAAMVEEMRTRARRAGLLTPHILPDRGHLSHRETALVLRAAGLSPLGPVALNVAAPDEGNMYLLRMTAILHGIKGRLARGTAASTQAQEYAAAVDWMAELAWSQVRRPPRQRAQRCSENTSSAGPPEPST